MDALGTAAWIHDIYVDEPARGRKVGALLMDVPVEAARELGSSSVMLVVAAQNENAFVEIIYGKTMQNNAILCWDRPEDSG